MIKGYSGVFRLGEATSTWDADSPVMTNLDTLFSSYTLCYCVLSSKAVHLIFSVITFLCRLFSVSLGSTSKMKT